MASVEEKAIDVLIVDDEPDVARIIAVNLEFDGYQVRIAGNGREALEEVKRKIPDCILLDIMMPVMDGWEVLQVLKGDESTADIPVIVVTAKHSDVDRIRGFSGGAIDYVTKPFDPEVLKEYVTRALQPRDEQTEREQRQDRIRKLQLSALHDITDALISTLEIEEVLEIIADKLLVLFDLDLCGICLVDPSGHSLHLASERSTLSLSLDDLALFDFTLEQLGEILGADPLDASSPQALFVTDFIAAETSGDLKRLQSLYLLPLKAKGGFTGVIFLGTEKQLQFSEEEKELLLAIGNQAAIAITNAKLYDDLRYDEEVHKQLLQKVITAQEDERRRVAVELHDGVIQNLVSALYRLQLCSARMGEPPQEVKDALREAQDIVDGGITEMRRIVAGLRPIVLDDMGMVVALQNYIRQLQEKAKFPIQIEQSVSKIPAITTESETALFRIAQEALNNVIKHSFGKHAQLSLKVDGEDLVLKIEDNGVGFGLPRMQNRTFHNYGLVGMRERAESLGGSLEIESTPGVGTLVTARLPLHVISKEV